MNLFTRLVRSAVSVLGLGCVAQVAQSVPILDQDYLTAGGFQVFSQTAQFTEFAQTFTAGITGDLTAISLQLGRRNSGASGTATVDIRDTESASASTGMGFIPAQIPGSPDIPPVGGTIFSSTMFDIGGLDVAEPTIGQVAGFSPIIALASPVAVVAGQMYSILLRFDVGDTSDDLVWYVNRNPSFPATAYAGGDAFYRGGSGFAWTIPNWDRGFRTYVEPLNVIPEPGSFFLVLTAPFAMLAFAGVRKEKMFI